MATGPRIVRSLVFWVSVMGAAVGATLYVAITMLYLAPPNPIKARHLQKVNAVMYPFFQQNWHLFAPNPIRSNFVLTARCRVGDRVSDWQDISTPLLARHHSNRNSPMGRLLRTPGAAVHQILGRSSDEWLPLICRRDPSSAACRGEDEVSSRVRENAQFIINRVASASCDRWVGIGHASAVQARILVHEPPPWSQRHLGAEAGTTRYVSLPWAEYQAWWGR